MSGGKEIDQILKSSANSLPFMKAQVGPKGLNPELCLNLEIKNNSVFQSKFLLLLFVFVIYNDW